MNPRKIVKISSVLVKSQLRSGRSGSLGARLLSNPPAVLVLDIAALALSAGLVYAILGAIGTLPAGLESLLDTMIYQVVTSLPAFIALAVFIAAVLFELSVSSKFASSDVVNWLPVSQTDYVTASTLSVSYMYSFLPALALGVSYPLAARLDLQSAWGVAAVLCLVALFAMGALVEIMRAAVNRVTSLVYGRAGRGTIVIRLAVTVLVILTVELGVNPVILSSLIGSFTGVVNAALFVPFFWPSASVSYLVQGQALLSGAFFGLSLAFAALALFAAVKVRARYWSPLPVTIEVTEAAYTPRTGGFLRSLGLSVAEAALVRKDLKGYTRRRELMPYLALPVVFVALIVVQQATTSFGSTETGTTVYPFWLVGGILAVLVGSTGVGQEGKAILNLYASPMSPGEFLRAKLLVAFLFGSTTVVAMAVVSSILASATPLGFAVSLISSLVIAIECTFIGVGFATRFPDLQERPRPRFVRPLGMILAMLAGIFSAFVTALPLLIWPFAGGYLEGLGLSFGEAVVGGVIFGGVVSFAAYRWARSGSSELMAEIPI